MPNKCPTLNYGSDVDVVEQEPKRQAQFCGARPPERTKFAYWYAARARGGPLHGNEYGNIELSLDQDVPYTSNN